MKTKTVTKSIKLFSNSEALTGNAVANLNINDLSFNQYNVITNPINSIMKTQNLNNYEVHFFSGGFSHGLKSPIITRSRGILTSTAFSRITILGLSSFLPDPRT